MAANAAASTASTGPRTSFFEGDKSGRARTSVTSRANSGTRRESERRSAAREKWQTALKPALKRQMSAVDLDTIVSAAFKRKLDWFSSVEGQSGRAEFMTDEQIVRKRWLILPNSRRKIAWDWMIMCARAACPVAELPPALGPAALLTVRSRLAPQRPRRVEPL